MGASFTLELHTSSPVVEMVAPIKTTYPTETYSQVHITADEALALDCQSIFIIDAKGFRHDYSFGSDGLGGLIREIDFSLIRGGMATIHAIVADDVWNSTEVEVMVNVEKTLRVNFIAPGSIVNPVLLSQANMNYKKGTANFTPDASKLVNKLWVKGGKATSDPYTQAITVSTTPIPLFYTPVAIVGTDVTVTIGGVVKTVGIQNVDKAGTKDFLLNSAEKLLIPDLCVTGTGTIVYRYEYPIKLLLENLESQAKYGLFEDIYNVNVTDKTLAKEMGLQYLAKYSSPVTTGSIEPMHGIYKPGELILIQIPSLNVDEYLQILEVSYESIKGMGLVNRTLTLQSRERDAVSILKDMVKRLAKIESTVFNDSEGIVEKYVFFADSVITPEFVDDGLTWWLHQYHICGQTICGTGVIL